MTKKFIIDENQLNTIVRYLVEVPCPLPGGRLMEVHALIQQVSAEEHVEKKQNGAKDVVRANG